MSCLAARLMFLVVSTGPSLGQLLPQPSSRRNLIAHPTPMSCTASCAELRRVKDTPDVICSCNSSCQIYGDCCRDAPFQNTFGVRTEPGCINLSGLGPVSVVDSCPPTSSSIMSEACATGTKVYGPVTSRDTGTSYMNFYCAACNGDANNLVDWPVKLQCCEQRSNTSLTAVKEYLQYGSDNDHMWMVSELKNGSRVHCECKFRPENDDLSFAKSLELRDCESDYISSCSHTWKSKRIRQLCSAYLDPVYSDDKTYRNRYCAMCNYESGMKLRCSAPDFNPVLATPQRLFAYCKARGIKGCETYLRARGHPASMTIMFAMYEEKCIPVGEKCCDGQRYDRYRKECRDVPKNVVI